MCAFVGERARWQLEDLMDQERGSLSAAAASNALRSLQRSLERENVLQRVAEDLGVSDLSVLPPTLTSWFNLQLLEHLLCEMYKIGHPETGMLRSVHVQSHDEYRKLLGKAFPQFTWESTSVRSRRGS